MKRLGIFVVELLIIHSVYSVDDTLVEKAKGTTVVEAVCSKIESTCIFENDNLLLRRTAFVETNDGQDQDTYRVGYYGGIWRVDQDMFDKTQATSSLYSYKQQIKYNFGIDWDRAKWSDLEKPFYSGLAARLILQLAGYNIPSSKSDQANFWKTHFRPSGDESSFINKVNAFKSECRGGAVDIAFVVDESGSIGDINYRKMKDFLMNIVSLLNVGPDPIKDTRLSIVKFSTFVQVAFDFKNYTTKEAYRNAIDKMSYYGGYTYTNLALKYLREEVFTQNFGARKDGIPRIAVVSTDGYSNDFSDTMAEAYKIKAENEITVITLGIGSSVNRIELKAIATEPYCKYLFMLDNFMSLDSFISTVETKTCKAPVIINPENPTTTLIPATKERTCKLTINSLGTTVEIYSPDGYSTIFFSNITIPSQSFYDLKLNVEPGSPSVMLLPYKPSNSENTSYAYCLIEGDPKKDINLTISTCPGDCDPCKGRPCPNEFNCSPQPKFTYKCLSDPLNAARNLSQWDRNVICFIVFVSFFPAIFRA